MSEVAEKIAHSLGKEMKMYRHQIFLSISNFIIVTPIFKSVGGGTTDGTTALTYHVFSSVSTVRPLWPCPTPPLGSDWAIWATPPCALKIIKIHFLRLSHLDHLDR